MAKRFTDTEKWKDAWYQSLSNDYKIICQWLWDDCDHAGILKRNIKELNYRCNTSITEEELLTVFKGKIEVYDGFYFLPEFLKFQYEAGLNSLKPVIKSVRQRLFAKNLHKLVNKLYGNDFLIIEESLTDNSKTIEIPFDNDYLIIKDKEKDKDKDKDKDKSKSKSKRKDKDKEKAKEVKSEVIKTSVTLPYSSEKFAEAWQTWINYRNQIKRPYKNDYSEQTMLKQLAAFDEEFSIGLIERAISNNYQGLIFSSTTNDFLKYRSEKEKESKNGTVKKSHASTIKVTENKSFGAL